MFSLGTVFVIVFGAFFAKIIFSLGAISAKRFFNFHNLADMGTKLLGYKELFDIATGNNKSNYGDLVDNIASNMLGSDKKNHR